MLNIICRCECDNCLPMPTADECRCCHEHDLIMPMLEEEGVDCMINHPGFNAVCLNKYVLQTAYFAYRQVFAREDITDDNK